MLTRPFKAPLSVVFDAATQSVDMIHAAPSFDRALEEVDEVRPQRGLHLDIGTRRWKGMLGMVSIFTGRK